MLSYILKRLLLMLPTLLGVLTVTFVVIQFVPGGPIEQIMAEARIGKSGEGSVYKAGRDSDAKQLAELKKLYGFDKPVQVRYVEMLASFARFDLGRSQAARPGLDAAQGRVSGQPVPLGRLTVRLSIRHSVPILPTGGARVKP